MWQILEIFVFYSCDLLAWCSLLEIFQFRKSRSKGSRSNIAKRVFNFLIIFFIINFGRGHVYKLLDFLFDVSLDLVQNPLLIMSDMCITLGGLNYMMG